MSHAPTPGPDQTGLSGVRVDRERESAGEEKRNRVLRKYGIEYKIESGSWLAVRVLTHWRDRKIEFAATLRYQYGGMIIRRRLVYYYLPLQKNPNHRESLL